MCAFVTCLVTAGLMLGACWDQERERQREMKKVHLVPPPSPVHAISGRSVHGCPWLGCLKSFARYAQVPYLGRRQMSTALFKLLLTAQFMVICLPNAELADHPVHQLSPTGIPTPSEARAG
ncbi:hypothetical protein F4825DRAFT_268556 [Nemania diffusa]|nr:hypothetical protein F4825DRAFT_268556 [Nemania diffusa]